MENFASVKRAASKVFRELNVGLYYGLAVSLCVMAITGVAIRGSDAVAALSWGWKDIVTPITSELKHGHQVNYGVYDTHRRFSEAKGVAVEHIFVSWLSNSDSISSSFQYANARNRWLMITIEPFAIQGRESQLLDDVVAGNYDFMITSTCRYIGSLQSSVFVRWGHEMETTDVRYPWSGAQAESYKAAYRHFAAKCRADAPNIYLVWSPKGAPGLEQYYPGRAFVDLVGLSLYELPAYDLDHFGKVMNFRKLFVPKYNRVIAFDRPVIIAEMGVSGDPSIKPAGWQIFFGTLKAFRCCEQWCTLVTKTVRAHGLKSTEYQIGR